MAIGGSWIAVVALGGGIVAWVYKLMAPERFRFNARDWTITAIYLFYFLVTLLFALVHAHPMAGLKQTAKLLPFLIMLPLLPVLRDAYRDYWLKWIVMALAAGGMAAGIGAIAANVIRQENRVEMLTGNPLVFAYLVAILSLVNLLITTYARGFWSAVFGAATVLSFVALVLSGSRAPIAIYLIAAFFVLAVRLVDEVSAATTRAWVIVAIMVAAPSAAIVSLSQFTTWEHVLKGYEGIVTTIAGSAADADMSTAARIDMIRAGWSAFAAHPFTGYGRQNVVAAANLQFPYDIEFSYTHLHNAFLTDAVASGILGILAFILMIITPLIASYGLQRRFVIASASLIIFISSYHTFNIGFYHDVTAINFSLIVVFLGCIPNRKEKIIL